MADDSRWLAPSGLERGAAEGEVMPKPSNGSRDVCNQKERFETHGMADAVAFAVRRRGNGGGPMAFWCRICHGWHIGGSSRRMGR